VILGRKHREALKEDEIVTLRLERWQVAILIANLGRSMRNVERLDVAAAEVEIVRQQLKMYQATMEDIAVQADWLGIVESVDPEQVKSLYRQ
jgi:hypothetical protein